MKYLLLLLIPQLALSETFIIKPTANGLRKSNGGYFSYVENEFTANFDRLECPKIEKMECFSFDRAPCHVELWPNFPSYKIYLWQRSGFGYEILPIENEIFVRYQCSTRF